jgi:hypothetical protein
LLLLSFRLRATRAARLLVRLPDDDRCFGLLDLRFAIKACPSAASHDLLASTNRSICG